jgi:hypothetical protein
MSTFVDFSELFQIAPEAPVMMGFVTTPSISPVNEATGALVCFEGLRAADLQPSGKWLWLQMTQQTALSLAASILSHAEKEGWPIPAGLMDQVERVHFSTKSEKKH